MDTNLVETRGEPLSTLFLRYTAALGGYPSACNAGLLVRPTSTAVPGWYRGFERKGARVRIMPVGDHSGGAG